MKVVLCTLRAGPDASTVGHDEGQLVAEDFEGERCTKGRGGGGGEGALRGRSEG